MTHGARIVVVSDRAHEGVRPDATGPLLVQELEKQGYVLRSDPIVIVPDVADVIEQRLLSCAADPTVQFIVTTGGTGVSARDVTPEATRRVLDRELPGFGEVMRLESRRSTKLAAASRAVAGLRGDTLIVNLPGSPRGAVECLSFIHEPARHVLDVTHGTVTDCGPARGEV